MIQLVVILKQYAGFSGITIADNWFWLDGNNLATVAINCIKFNKNKPVACDRLQRVSSASRQKPPSAAAGRYCILARSLGARLAPPRVLSNCVALAANKHFFGRAIFAATTAAFWLLVAVRETDNCTPPAPLIRYCETDLRLIAAGSRHHHLHVAESSRCGQVAWPDRSLARLCNVLDLGYFAPAPAPTTTITPAL